MVLEFLQGLDQWHWFALALIFFVLEVFITGTFCLWFGLSAAVVGSIVIFNPLLSWQHQLLAFALSSLVSLIGWQVYRQFHPEKDTKFKKKPPNPKP